jgi:hypothetical protein
MAKHEKAEQAEQPPPPPPAIPHQKSQEAGLAKDELARQLNLAGGPPPEPEGELSGKKGEPSHYVVLHGQIGAHWMKGDVVSAESFGHRAAALEANGAIRPATADEAEQFRPLEEGAPPAKRIDDLSPEDQVSELTRKLTWHAENARRLSAQLEAAHTQQMLGKGPPPGWIDPKLVAEKDRVMADQYRQIVELRRQLQDIEKAAADPEPAHGHKGRAKE